MKKIHLYKIDLDYIKYLHTYCDNRVQFNKDKPDCYNSNRPYIGIVFTINNIDYFAPLEHPRPAHINIKSNPHILKIKNGKYGLIAFNNMIPVHKSLLIDFDINSEINHTILLTQFQFCNNKKDEIYKRAKNVYEKRINKPNNFELKIYCDFKILESGMIKYCEEHNLK